MIQLDKEASRLFFTISTRLDDEPARKQKFVDACHKRFDQIITGNDEGRAKFILTRDDLKDIIEDNNMSDVYKFRDILTGV